MEQRRLRLGDIVDDYCTRERRVTNHAVVAMIEEEIKQTRCTTCDAEHPYKGGQAPRRRKKDSSSLYKEVLAGKPAGKNDDAPHLTPPAPVAAARAADAESDAVEPEVTVDDISEDAIEPVEVTAPDDLDAASTDGDVEHEEPRSGDLEDGPVHRPLIRATLPRPEGQKDVRNPPDFTIRQAGGRSGKRQSTVPRRRQCADENARQRAVERPPRTRRSRPVRGNALGARRAGTRSGRQFPIGPAAAPRRQPQALAVGAFQPLIRNDRSHR